jgi:pilus assembly protein CpaB
MKNTRVLIMLAVAILAGVAAVILASQWLNQRSQHGLARIAVTTTEISLGQRITPEMVKLTDWPSSSIPPGAITELSKLEGRVVRTALQPAEPVLEAKLAPQGTQGGLSAVIAEGRRAITVRVNDVIGVAGFALPGNYVDIIVNTQKDEGQNGNKEQNISKIVLEKILVLAVAQEVGRDETKPKVVNAVTLEVAPDEAEKIDLARSVGTLSLVLRNQVDALQASTLGATKASLLDPNKSMAAADKTLTKTSTAKPSRSAHSSQKRPKSAVVNASAASLLSQEQRSCVGVINGLRNSQECY